MSQSLESLISNFAERPTVASREMRSLLDADRVRFAADALGLLSSREYSPGHHCALALLVSNNLIVDRICNPQDLTTAAAIRMSKQIAGIDPHLAVKLVRKLLPRNGAPPEITGPAPAQRVLEIVESISDGTGLMTPLVQLLQIDDTRVRSKVVLLIGRMNRNLRWVEQRLQEPDARVRANSVEALWGLDTPEAVEMFRQAAQDPDNRVAGNGAIGLHRCGRLEVAEVLTQMLSREDAAFRATAAWAMGQVEDPRFLSQLTPLLTDPDPLVRQNVLRAIFKIRRRTKLAAEGPRIETLIARAGSTETTCRVHLAVTAGGGQPVPRLLPIEITLTDSGQVVNDFQLVERVESESTTTLCMAPRFANRDDAWNAAIADMIRALLPFKRKQDGWLLQRYQAAAQEPAAAAESGGEARREVPPPATDPNALLNAIEAAGTPTPAAPSLANGLRQAIPALSVARGPRYIWFFAQAPLSVEDCGKVGRAAGEAGVILSGATLGFAPDQSIQEMCALSGGDCVAAPSPAELHAVFKRAAARMSGAYILEYPLPAETAGPLKVQIYSRFGMGEDTLNPS